MHVAGDRLYTLVERPEARRAPARAALPARRRGLCLHLRLASALGSRRCTTSRQPTATSACRTVAAAAAGSCCHRSRSGSGTTSVRRTVRDGPCDRATRVRPRRHALRPGEQLRAAVRVGGGDVRPPAGEDLAPYRDELVVSTKAGYDMWPGPYGEWGSRKYLLASLDQSLARLGLDYVDIFYSHRFDPETPLEETMGALDTAVRQGKALYAGISSYSRSRRARRRRSSATSARRSLIHQPNYSHARPLDRARPARRARAQGSAASSSRRSRRGC